MTQGHGHPGGRAARLIQVVAGLVVWNLIMGLARWWHPYWWAGLAVNFVLVVMLAENVGRYVPAHRKARYERGLAVAFPILLLVTWEMIVRAEILSPRWFPPPTQIAGALWELTVTYDRFSKTSLFGRPWLAPQAYRAAGWSGVWALLAESHVLTTLVRVFAGFFIGAIPGIFLGIVMGVNKTVRLMLDATLSAVYVLPKIAIFPIVMLVFANPFGEGPKIAVVAISAFFLVVINTMAGVRDIDPVLIQAGRNYGARGWQLYRHVIIPAALPIIFAGLRLALGTALIVIVAVEFIRAKKGVGFMTFYYWEILAPEKMYAGLVVVMALGALLTYGLQWVEKRVMPWQT